MQTSFTVTVAQAEYKDVLYEGAFSDE